ncbi:MAG TPA: TlpA disulfide reductase family protein [Candidatus Saccharimonadales bacterium]|nr:TlpA disulfide reductase family protein [Candidatus Saccharimonadales bacterium]
MSPAPVTNPAVVLEPRRAHRRGIGPFSLRQLVIVNTILALVALVLYLGTQPLAPVGSSPAAPGPTFYAIGPTTQGLGIGQLAPELFSSAAGGLQLRDLDGHPVSLAALRGHPVWINFWATWCPPCQQETPDLRDAFNAHRADGLVLIAIDVQEDPATVRAYAQKYSLAYTIGMDLTGNVMAAYRVWGLPTHYFIDRTGVIRDRYFGPLSRAQIEAKLAEIERP